MNWLNLKTHIRTKPEFIGSEPAQRATWLCLMFYCVEHENAGAINDCLAWGDRQWQQTCGITKDEVYSTCKLWSFDRSSLVIWGYPIEQERECMAKREAGRKGGKNSAAARKRIAAEQNQAELEAKVEAELQRKGKERKGIENKGNTPCSGGGTAAASDSDQGIRNIILPQPERALRVDLSDERNFYRADVTSIACTICDLFPDKSGKSGGYAGQITQYLRTLAAHKGVGADGDKAASEIVRPLLIQFWSEIKAGEEPYSRTAVLLTKMTRLLEAHGCS